MLASHATEMVVSADAGMAAPEALWPQHNPFFDSWALDAAVAHLRAPGEQVETVVAPDNSALLPLAPWLNMPLGPGTVWTVWSHVHSYDATPSLENDALLDAVFAFLKRRRASMLRWSGLPTDTVSYARLIAYLQRRNLGFEVTKSGRRPMLVADHPDGARHVADYIGGKRLREFRRCRRRLEEFGKLELKTYDGPHCASAWMADFLEIEASGWKGEGGTALASSPGGRAYFEALAGGAAARGQALVYSLELEGKPIAMTVNFRAGTHIWCFKTAYRDDLAKFSPGALIEYEATLAAFDDPSVELLDSCSAHDGGLMGDLWQGRREIVDLVIATHPASNRLVRATGMLWRAYLAAKRATRDGVGQFARSKLRDRTQPAY